MLVENLHEETLIALRAWDGIRNAGGDDAIIVDREMLCYARGVRATQKNAVEERKRREAELDQLSRYEKEQKKRKTEELIALNKEKEELPIKQNQLDMKMIKEKIIKKARGSLVTRA